MNAVYTASVDHFRAFARFNSRKTFPRYRELLRRQRLTIVRLARASVLTSPVLMVVGGAHLLLNRQLLGLFPLAVGALYVVLITWFLLPSAQRQRQEQGWAKAPNLGKPIDVAVDDAGFHFIEATIERHVDWNAVIEIEESATHIFVVDRQPMVYLIPKAAFASQADAEAFAAYIRTHMAR